MIGIIAVLAAMLLPVLGMARGKARRSSCMSNLNQLGKAMEAYGSEYGGYFPSYVNWGVDPRLDVDARFSVTNPAVQSVYAAAAGDAGTTVNLSPSSFRTVAYGYGQNGHEANKLSCAPVGLGKLMAAGNLNDIGVLVCPSAAPPGTPRLSAVQDPEAPWGPRHRVRCLYAGPGRRRRRTLDGFAKRAHGDGYNVLYADWHGKWYGDAQGRIRNYDRAAVQLDAQFAELSHQDVDAATGEAISANMGFEIWHQFDVSDGIDAPKQ